jgi:predicted glycosyltransferase
MKILIYLGHPAQYHFFKNIVKKLQEKHDVRYLIKTKEVLEPLLKEDNVQYKNILPEGRKSTKFGIVWGLVKRELKVLYEAVCFRPNLMLGTDPSLAHIGKLLRIPVLTVLEDDVQVIYDLAKITFPFSTYIVAPDSCDCGKWNNKKIPYAGYMKLAYLHPNYFSGGSKEKKEGNEKALIRLSNLEAFHDKGINGFNEELLKQTIEKLEAADFKVQLSSEKIMNAFFDKYMLKINPSQMHKVLCNADILISDSQSMTMEAAMLGIPSIRYSDFSGRIGVLEELEHKYQLTFGVKPGNPGKLTHILDGLLSMGDIQEEFQIRRKKMLDDKIDVTMFFTWLIENFPESAKIIQESPDYQYGFK